MVSASAPIGNRKALTIRASTMTTQPTAPSVVPKSSAMAGSTRNTIELAMTVVMNDRAIAAKAYHFDAADPDLPTHDYRHREVSGRQPSDRPLVNNFETDAFGEICSHRPEFPGHSKSQE